MRTTGYRHASPCQRHRHHRRMIITCTIAPLWFCRDVPNRSEPTLVGTANDIYVIVVVLALGEQKHRLMRFRWSIPNRLRVRVRLVPNDLGTNPPTGILKREGEAPRESDQILGLESSWSYRPHRHGTSPVLFVRRAIATVAGRIRITDIEPYGAIVGQYATELFEHVHDTLQVVVQRIVATDLSIYLVIPKRPVRRRCDHGLNAPRGEQFHGLARAPAHENRLVQCNGRAWIRGVETHIGGAS